MNKAKKRLFIGVILFMAFVAASAFVYEYNFALLGFILGVFACMSVLLTVSGVNTSQANLIVIFAIKYTWPIFLCHTLAAAPVRIALMKFGVLNPVVHITAGIIVTFFVPVGLAVVADKLKPLDFVFYPQRYIKVGRRV
jgi:hypothetical protein